MIVDSRKLQIHNLYSSPNIIESDQVKGNEMSRECNTYGAGVPTGSWCESQKERDHEEDQDRDVRMIRWMGARGLVSSGSGWESVTVHFEHGNEHAENFLSSRTTVSFSRRVLVSRDTNVISEKPKYY
jgi:hypothetical protein